MPGRPPRRHHYLPQMYQRAFANAKGQVRVVHVDGSLDYTTKTINAFVETDYYTVASVDTEEDHELVESRIYVRMEGIVDPILRDLVAGTLPVTLQLRSEFASFMALQVTRGPHHRAFSDHVAEKMSEAMQMGMAMAPPEYWERKRLEWQQGGRVGPEPPGPFTPEQQRQLAHGEMLRVRSTKQNAIEMSFAAFEELTKIFYVMDWSLVSFERPCLFSGPLAVTYWRRETGGHWDHMGIGPITAEEVVLPLSPSRALVLTHPPEDQLDPTTVGTRDRMLVAAEATAGHLNWVTLQWNDQLLVSPEVTSHPVPANPAQVWVGAVSAPRAGTG